MYRIVAVFCMAAAAFAQRAEPVTTARFIGSWELVSYELRLPSGAITKPFGDRPIGRILYQSNGQMSAQLMQPAATPFASSDPLKATREETERAWRNYIGYWGSFRVDAKAGTVTHRVEGGWLPNWIDQEQVRTFRFERDRLVLEADTAAWHATLIWRKMTWRRIE